MMSNETPKPYQQAEAVVDALAGGAPCGHGLWPHQGECGACSDDLDRLLSIAEAAAGVWPPSQVQFVIDGVFARNAQ